MKKCDCGNKEMIGVEYRGGYDGISLRECKECGKRYDRRSKQRIIGIYTQPLFEYGQPMFLLEDGSMSRLDERWINPLHKKMKLNWKKPQWEK